MADMKKNRLTRRTAVSRARKLNRDKNLDMGQCEMRPVDPHEILKRAGLSKKESDKCS